MKLVIKMSEMPIKLPMNNYDFKNRMSKIFLPNRILLLGNAETDLSKSKK